MTTTRACECIGGPLDGEIMDVDDGIELLQIPIWGKLQLFHPVVLTVVRYRRADGGTRFVFAGAEQI